MSQSEGTRALSDALRLSSATDTCTLDALWEEQRLKVSSAGRERCRLVHAPLWYTVHTELHIEAAAGHEIAVEALTVAPTGAARARREDRDIDKDR